MSRARDGRQGLLDAVGMAMREASGLGVLHSQAMASKLGINSTDLECLDLVAFGRDVTAGVLAEATGLTTGAITGVIDRLERAGLVRRERDDNDRRKVIVVATSLMQRRAEPLGGPMREAVAEVLARYDDDQLKFLRQALGEVCDAAKKAIAELQALGLPRPSRKARGPRRRR
jgi:DNA-binding MarR family transcriptional regulator